MAEPEPSLRVVRGTPTAEELAALVGVLAARTRTQPPAAGPGPSRWVLSGRPAAGGGWRDWWR